MFFCFLFFDWSFGSLVWKQIFLWHYRSLAGGKKKKDWRRGNVREGVGLRIVIDMSLSASILQSRFRFPALSVKYKFWRSIFFLFVRYGSRMSIANHAYITQMERKRPVSCSLLLLFLPPSSLLFLRFVLPLSCSSFFLLLFFFYEHFQTSACILFEVAGSVSLSVSLGCYFWTSVSFIC